MVVSKVKLSKAEKKTTFVMNDGKFLLCRKLSFYRKLSIAKIFTYMKGIYEL